MGLYGVVGFVEHDAFVRLVRIEGGECELKAADVPGASTKLTQSDSDRVKRQKTQ